MSESLKDKLEKVFAQDEFSGPLTLTISPKTCAVLLGCIGVTGALSEGGAVNPDLLERLGELFFEAEVQDDLERNFEVEKVTPILRRFFPEFPEFHTDPSFP